MMKEKLEAAIKAKKNDINSYVWKLARTSEGVQEEIKLMEATPEQLKQFYNHCESMLYSKDKANLGRYALLNMIKDQREKCNVELYLRKLNSGSLTNGVSYPRNNYCQDIMECIQKNRDLFPSSELSNISIASITGGIPSEFSRLSIASVIDGCLDQLGNFQNKYVTFGFLLSLGVYLTPEEMSEFTEKDEEGKNRSKLELIKERLNIKPSVFLAVKPSGLSYTELRAMLNLHSQRYSKLSTDQLTTLRDKVLFRLEQKVNYHIEQWEERITQILKVADARGIKVTA